MRLIDANKLKKLFTDNLNESVKQVIAASVLNQIIDAQPTFDPWHYPEKGDLPAETDKVLVVIKEHRIQADYIPPEAKVGRLKWNGEFFEFNGSDYFKDEIIKWMPLELEVE